MVMMMMMMMMIIIIIMYYWVIRSGWDLAVSVIHASGGSDLQIKVHSGFHDFSSVYS
jgi:hypothetical protein